MESTPTITDLTSSQNDESTIEKATGSSKFNDVATAASSAVFDSVTKLPSDLVPTGMQVNKFSGYYVRLNTNPKYFDWNGFVYAVNSYHGGDLVGVPLDATKSHPHLKHGVIPGSDFDIVRISSDDPPDDDTALEAQVGEKALQEILNWMIHHLHDVLGVQVDVGELTATVYGTFTNLQWAHTRGFADFSSSSSGTNSSWEYRTVYAFPTAGDPTKFFSMVTTIKLAANISTQSSWWGLVSSTRARFYAEIVAGKLRITKGFRSPV